KLRAVYSYLPFRNRADICALRITQNIESANLCSSDLHPLVPLMALYARALFGRVGNPRSRPQISQWSARPCIVVATTQRAPVVHRKYHFGPDREPDP